MTWRARLRGGWALLHPGPSLLTVGAFILCAGIAAHGLPDLAKLALSVGGMVCQQFAISALNDYCDRAADAQSQHKRKPIVLGQVSPQFALILALALAVAMVIIFAPLGWLAEMFAGIFLVLGFAYDLGIKSTPISGVMHGLAFPTIPLLAWTIFAHLTLALFWVVPLGMALGIGLHLADAIPDAEADARAGVRGLTQSLGGHALAVCWGAFAVGIVIVALLAVTGMRSRLPLALACDALASGLLLAAIQSWRNQAHNMAQRFKRNFGWLVATAFVLVVGFFATVAL